MHPITFALKRAHHSTLAGCRAILRPLKLTPARFDLLHILAGPRTECRSAPQRSLHAELGVTAPVVSRMLKSLEALGLVRRARMRDARKVFVTITDAGLDLLRRAMARAIGTGALEHLLASALVDRWFDGRCVERGLRDVDRTLGRIRSYFRDRARLHYLFHFEPWTVTRGIPNPDG